jgi:hypothetical protein
MSQTVIHCALSCAALLGKVGGEPLFRMADGVAAVSHEVMLKSLIAAPGVSILYFTRQDYDEAMKDLTAAEREEVARRRISAWSSSPMNQWRSWFHPSELRCLAFTALARIQVPQATKTLDAHFEQALELLTRYMSEGRYDHEDLPSLLAMVVEDEATLIAELKLAGGTTEAETHEKFATTINLELVRFGKKEAGEETFFGHVEPTRGVFVTPRDKDLIGYIRAGEQPFVEWNNGAATTSGVSHLREFEALGKRVVVLYEDAGEFYGALDLTVAQRNREFKKRVNADSVAHRRRLADYLSSLRLGQILMRRVALARAKKADAKVVDILERQVKQETATLASELANHVSWVPDEKHSSSALLLLCHTEEDLVNVTAILLALGRARGDAELEREIAPFLANKKKDQARAASLCRASPANP